jgi:site-specific recombinase XerD
MSNLTVIADNTDLNTSKLGNNPFNLDSILNSLNSSNLAVNTKERYKESLTNAVHNDVNLVDSEDITSYMNSLSNSQARLFKSAHNKAIDLMATKVKTLVNPDNIGSIQATLLRLEALKDIQAPKVKKGTIAHTWLNLSQVKQLLATTKKDNSLINLRNRVLIALIVGSGLRRSEAIALKFSDIVKQGERFIINVRNGKGDKSRAIPISTKLAKLLYTWQSTITATNNSYVLLGINRHSKDTGKLTQRAINNIVSSIFEETKKQFNVNWVNINKLTPHDLRRTYAQIGYNNGVDIAQISKLLGHSDIKTTQIYLNINLDLSNTIGDFIPV